MAVSNVALFGAAFLTPVFVGKITKSLGWQWSFYFVAIFLAASLPFMILFVSESAFKRPDYLNIDFRHTKTQSDSSDSRLNESTADAESKYYGPSSADTNVTTEVSAAAAPKKDSFLKSLRLFNGRKTDEHFFKLLFRPFPLFFHPGILWVSYAGLAMTLKLIFNPRHA